jgi:hypothetical protein
MEGERTPHLPITKSKSQAHLLLELTAISGEYPAENIRRIIPSTSYAKKVVTALINDKQIKLVNKGGVRGYRLETKAKRQLLSENHARYKEYMGGATDTNKQRSDQPRRLRLHSAAEVYTLMYNARIRIFKDTKPKIYQPDTAAIPSQTALSQTVGESTEGKATLKTDSPPIISVPCFYSSREQKGEDDYAIRGSRAVGTLLTPTHVYAIYNTGSAESRWRESVEMRYRADVQDFICRKMLLAQYNGKSVGGIMIGECLEVLEKYLVAQTKTGAAHNFLAKTYQPFYFITNNDHGESQLRILCDNARMTEIKTAMQKGLLPADAKYPIEHDALTEDGNPVLFCCLLNVPRLVQFRAGIQLHGKFGKVIAFDFQKEMLERYLGGMVEFKTLNFNRLMEVLFPASYRALRDAVPPRSKDA